MRGNCPPSRELLNCRGGDKTSLWILLVAGVPKAPATHCTVGCRVKMGVETVRMWFLTARSLPSSGGDGTVAQETAGEQHSLSLHMETFTHTLQAEGRNMIATDQAPGVEGRKKPGGCRQLGRLWQDAGLQTVEVLTTTQDGTWRKHSR